MSPERRLYTTFVGLLLVALALTTVLASRRGTLRPLRLSTIELDEPGDAVPSQ